MEIANQPTLSIVIPTLNEAGRLGPILDSLGDKHFEIIIVDGGSIDGTRQLAAEKGARVIVTPPGRGLQLAAGAAKATGQWMLFLHADTRLSKNWLRVANAFMANQGNQQRAAVFCFRLDDESASARRLEAIVLWRTRQLALPYGDQGLLIHRALYDQLGGYRALPLMEDVDMVRRLGGGKITLLNADAITSADRYRRHGYFMRPLRNLLCLALFFLGLPPRLIVRIYQ